MALQREVLVVIGIGVVRLQEGRGGEDEAARPQGAEHLGHGGFGKFEMLEHGLAVDSGQRPIGHRQRVGIAGDVDAVCECDVEIVEAGMNAPRAAADRGSVPAG